MKRSSTIKKKTIRLHASTNLLNHNLPLHASATVWLAVIVVLASLFEFNVHGLSRGVQIVFFRDLFGVHSRWNCILVKDDVMGESHVVHKLNRLASFYGNRIWDELEDTTIRTELNGGASDW